MGRATQGVRLIKLNDDDRISSIEKVQRIEEVTDAAAVSEEIAGQPILPQAHAGELEVDDTEVDDTEVDDVEDDDPDEAEDDSTPEEDEPETN